MNNNQPREESEVEILAPGYESLSLLSKAEIDIQISTAHAYRRSLQRFNDNAMSMLTLNEKTAEECYYSLKRKDKDGNAVKIEGASIRLAEIAACCYGNLRAGGRVVEQDNKDGFITAQGVCHDLENNLSVQIEVRRRITTSSGRLYGADMIMTTGNAAVSIAYRNAVLRVIPKALWFPLFEKARQIVRGDEKTLEKRRDDLLTAFKKMKVTEKMLLDYLEVGGMKDIGIDEVADLRGVFTAIQTGETTVEKAFALDEPLQAPQRKAPNVQSQTATGPATAPASTPAAPEPPKGDADPLLSIEQQKLIQQSGFNAGWSIAEQKQMLKKEFGVDEYSQVRLSQLDKITNIISSGTGSQQSS